ncbi:hypothetical protein JR316_0009269 [Psilocybe cubensis]|uniref:Uncharacterized protein n=1 Tax=Psilocybe cubensis TaxID=181762 RepID=A0ACB8GT42_PSICU|nr:hypothetical protein JR316_0009269 [Psilocybe cubensis]KAH9478808.1 hypothetical protein JR316_0009269 [Psilocybe cubensis]
MALLFVIGETGPNVSVDEFNDWYDNEHAPKRLTVPGFDTARRYKAVDAQTPTWLAIYDLASPSVPFDAPYKSLVPSDKDKSIIPRLEFFTRSVWELISEQPSSALTAAPAHLLIVTCLATGQKESDELNKWYETEHIPDILAVGCTRARRYKLVESVDLTKKTNPSPDEVHNYLAVYDFPNGDYINNPAFGASVRTPWALKALAPPVQMALRRFELHKDIQNPEGGHFVLTRVQLLPIDFLSVKKDCVPMYYQCMLENKARLASHESLLMCSRKIKNGFKIKGTDGL